jgi:nucleotide-binding universal stress UspA family protein
VVVATDFSDCSATALDVAATLSKAPGASLTVIHVTPSVWSLPPDLSVGLPGDSQNWFELLKNEGQRRLEEFVERARSRGVNPTGCEVLTGSPAHAVLEYARQNDCDLIVVGTHGRSGVVRMMLGSVAEAVVHHATTPVLTVRS